MDGASLAAYKEMQRVIKFVLDTRTHCLKMQPRHESETWDLVLYCDSDGQETLSPESVSLDSSCICLESQFAGDPRLKRV
jgi:hypothetical protein